MGSQTMTLFPSLAPAIFFYLPANNWICATWMYVVHPKSGHQSWLCANTPMQNFAFEISKSETIHQGWRTLSATFNFISIFIPGLIQYFIGFAAFSRLGKLSTSILERYKYENHREKRSIESNNILPLGRSPNTLTIVPIFGCGIFPADMVNNNSKTTNNGLPSESGIWIFKS